MRLEIVFRRHLIAGIILFNFLSSPAQVPFSKGVNITNWFQAPSANEIQFSRFTRKDFEQIKSLGCDVVRLPINLHAMTNGEPDYVLDPLFLTFLDQVVTWAEALQIHLILDNHTFDPAQNTSPDIGPVLVKVWTQMAEHYKGRSSYLYYEVLNEPHGIGDALWAGIQQSVINAIRTVDTEHYIVVGPANWNSYANLDFLPAYADTKLIYTFHFYDPFIFSHQGASWTDPSLVPLSGVPFPYNPGTMPTIPNTLRGTWIESAFNNYSQEGTVSKVKSLLDIAVNFKTQRNVPLFCGEFGIYMPNSNNTDRVVWYETVKKYLDQNDIAWTIWDYKEAFGLFEKGTNELFDYDLNVPLLNSLGMNVPPQQVYNIRPQTSGFTIYDDFIGEGIVNASNRGTGELNLYSSASPSIGKYCLYWTGSEQYSSIGFDFKPDKDLSLLRSHGHVLKFWVKGNSVASKFDIRLVDTKTGENDHPWRMGKTIEQIISEDMNWHEVTIPLSELEEKGSWDNGWFNPEGKFDWTSIDRFEIVAEHHDLNATQFWFDEIIVFGDEVPYEEPVTSVGPEISAFDFQVFPNPVVNATTINFSLAKPSSLNISIFTTTGKEIASMEISYLNAGDHSLALEEITKGSGSFSPGLYLVKLSIPDRVQTKRVVKAFK